MKVTKTVTRKIEIDGQCGKYRIRAGIIDGCVNRASVTDEDTDPDYFHRRGFPMFSFKNHQDLLDLKEALEELDTALQESSGQW